jgi:hypothetical protein
LFVVAGPTNEPLDWRSSIADLEFLLSILSAEHQVGLTAVRNRIA